ncbi:hypothetical protein QR680_003142 [Steinernema hermaphroditum]|uniref:DEP domain-containing protein n=1 Tax=Steinernema hermaphroditum TaxID=289476 RepID=A0AA39LJ52_9BILA|nr:hypothetical protein QR680_003142 [Steinernema hermaphroditum]
MKRRGSSPGGASLSAHRALNVLNEEAENNPQFQATQLWNRITRKFCKDVPRKRHRRNIRFYDDTFTGKEAIDFLLGVLPTLLDGNRDVTRAKCILLAEKFFENDIIRHFRGDHLIGFKDSDLRTRISASSQKKSSRHLRLSYSRCLLHLLFVFRLLFVLRSTCFNFGGSAYLINWQRFSYSTVLNEQFDGADVKWNAECIGSRGIVKAPSENGEFPTILMKVMRYVA